MAFNIKKDIFEPTMRSIERMNKNSICSFCKSGLDSMDVKCSYCGAPIQRESRQEEIKTNPIPRRAGPGRMTS